VAPGPADPPGPGAGSSATGGLGGQVREGAEAARSPDRPFLSRRRHEQADRRRGDWAAVDALVACVRDHPPDDPVPELAAHVAAHGVAGVAEAAGRHGVVGCLWLALRACGLSERDDATPVRERYLAGLGGYLRTLSDLELVDEALGAAGTRYLVLKGPVLAGAVYRRPDLRTFVDLDLLVAPRDFPLALSSLQEAGCRLYEENWVLARERLLGKLRLFTPAGTVVDLHWSLFAERPVRAAFPVSIDAVTRRRRTVRLADRPFETLDEVDTLVHLALHAGLSGGHRLVWLKDLEQTLLRGREDGWLDWETVTQRAWQWNAGPPVALMLARARAVLGVEVPDEVLRRLAPGPGWRAVTRVADRLVPVSRVGGRGSLSRLVARSARGDSRSSLRELTRRSGAWLRHGDGWHAPAVHDLSDRTDPESAGHPAGGESERAAYLSEVSRQPG
jgi:Uncharacterised nucleotidyltransferase